MNQRRPPMFALAFLTSVALLACGCDDGGGSTATDASYDAIMDGDAQLGDGTIDTTVPPDSTAGDNTSTDLEGDGDTVADGDGTTGDSDIVEPSVPLNQQATSGARLKAMWAVADDGQRSFRGWHDALEDVECTFRLAMDGELRCLPKVLEQGPEADRGFLGDTCAGATVLADRRSPDSAACSASPFFVSRDATLCPGTRHRVEALGAENAQSTYFMLEEQTCWETDAQSVTLYDLTDRPASDWVRGVLVYEGGDDAIAAAIVEAEDGARGYFGLAIPSLDHAECHLELAADGERRCLPARRAYAWGLVWEDLFADDACTVHVAQTTQADRCVTRFGLRYDDRGSCAPKMSVHEIGPTFDTMMYRGSNGSCSEQGQTGGPGSFTTGPEIPAETFAAYIDVAEPPMGDARLVRLPYAVGALQLGSGAFFDTELDYKCSFMPTADGTLRCMPGQFTFTAYADDACTELLVLTEREQCAVAPLGHVLVGEASGCETTYRSFALGDVYTGDTFYSKLGESCVVRQPMAGELGWTRASTEVALGELVSGELVTDP